MTRTRKRKTEEKNGVTKKMKMTSNKERENGKKKKEKSARKRKRKTEEKESKTRKRSKKIDQKKSGKSKIKNRVATPRPEPVEVPRLPPYDVDKDESEEITTITSYPKKKPKRLSLNQKVTFNQEKPLILPNMDHNLSSRTLSMQNNVTNVADEEQEKEMEPEKEEEDGLGVLFVAIWIAFVSQLLTLYDFEDYKGIIIEYFGHPVFFFTLVNLALYSLIFAITKSVFVDVSRQICCIRCLQAFCFVFPSAVLNFYPTSSVLFYHTSQRLACMFFGYIVAEQLYTLVVCSSNQETLFSVFKNVLLLASFVFVEMHLSFETMITFAMIIGIQINVIHIIVFAIYHLEWSFEFEIASTIACFISAYGSAIPPAFYDNIWNSFLEKVFDKEFILNIINMENGFSHF